MSQRKISTTHELLADIAIQPAEIASACISRVVPKDEGANLIKHAEDSLRIA
jgi:hypothetical protein